MKIAQPEEESPSCCSRENKIFVGLTLTGKDIHLAVRMGGREVVHRRFPSTSLGTTALLNYLTSWRLPVRLAIATAGAAAISLALAVGAQQHDREVFIVSVQPDYTVSDLARYAERAI